MITLAALRFRRIMESSGGPISRMVACPVVIQGVAQYQVNAFLRPVLLKGRPDCQFFSDAAGTGTALTRTVARHKAVAEAMERWAYLELKWQGCPRFGLEVDPSSNGFAAFPGWRARQARQAAYWEAVERFGVMAWWEGRAAGVRRDTGWPGVHAVLISAGLPGATVVLFRQWGEGRFAYGQAARPTYQAACLQAAVEMERHSFVVQQYLNCSRTGENSQTPHSLSMLEQRSMYFACDDGHQRFQQRLSRTIFRPETVAHLAYDGAVPGPWGEYADVWRVVFTPPSNQSFEEDHTYFYW